ncbi:hypothetical protein C6341_g2291 [Phytophthora cactorum]|nr:hypothetical protein C6341_g2291 [Phytophthora cactorum]
MARLVKWRQHCASELATRSSIRSRTEVMRDDKNLRLDRRKTVIKDLARLMKKFNAFNTEQETFRCFVCRKPMHINDYDVERLHVVSRADGGDCSLAYLVPGCLKCNRSSEYATSSRTKTKTTISAVQKISDEIGSELHKLWLITYVGRENLVAALALESQQVVMLLKRYINDPVKTRIQVNMILGAGRGDHIFDCHGGWKCFRSAKCIDFIKEVLAVCGSKVILLLKDPELTIQRLAAVHRRQQHPKKMMSKPRHQA